MVVFAFGLLHSLGVLGFLICCDFVVISLLWFPFLRVGAIYGLGCLGCMVIADLVGAFWFLVCRYCCLLFVLWLGLAGFKFLVFEARCFGLT